VSAFKHLDGIGPQLLAKGYVARAVHGERITLAVVEIEPGVELPEHRHENEQLGIVFEGSVRFRVGGEQRTLGPGWVWRIPSDTPHTVTGGDEGAVVMDVFSPARDEWTTIDRLATRPASWPRP